MKQRCIIILGMHRGGTSAVTRVLNLAGVELGRDLLPPAEDNPEGFWEHKKLVAINEKIFTELVLYWDCTLPMPNGWLEHPAVKALEQEAEEFITSEFPNVAVFALKDPRLCRTLPFWIKILSSKNIELQILLTQRSAMEIASSLARRQAFTIEKSLMLWAWHVLDAVNNSQGLSRVTVSYDAVLENPLIVPEAVRLPVDETVKTAIYAFINPQLRHHRKPESQPTDPFLQQLVQSLESMESDFTSEDTSGQFIELRNQFIHWLDKYKPVMFWHQDAMKGRQVEDKLHLRNLEIGSLNERLTVLDIEAANLKNQVNALTHHNTILTHDIENIRNSTSWKVTAPLRLAGRVVRNWRKFFRPQSYKMAYGILRQKGVVGLKNILLGLPNASGSGVVHPNYHEWIRRYETLTPQRRTKIEKQLEQLKQKPLISVLMPIYNVEEKWLRLAVESVQAQLYPHWELCIADDASPAPHIRPLLEQLMKEDARIKVIFREKNGHISESSNSALTLACGEFVALMDHDDVLSPEALLRVAEAVNQHPDAMMLYSDEDKIDTEGKRYSAYFKSDWNTDLFYAHNMFSHLGVYRRSLMEKVGGFRKGFEGSQDYDLALRCLEQVKENQIVHLPYVLYHWRSIPGSTSIALNEKSYAGTAAQKALYEHFARTYPGKKIELAPTFIPGSLRVVWPLPEQLPLVSLIIPTRNGLDVLSVCVSSILKKTRYVNYEILIVDNQSDDPRVLAYFVEIQQQDARVRVVQYNHPFNYSAINNFAAEQTKGDIIGLINNDIEVMHQEDRCWLTEMVSHVMRPEVGAVGAKLYYPNGTVQHGGVLTGLGGPDHAVAGHLFVGLTKDDAGYFARGIVTQQLSAVTAACMLVRRDVFDEVGGLDAENLPVAFNDVDFCLKIRKAGYKIIWTPFAELIHHESVSRGKEDTPAKKARALKEVNFMRNKWGEFLQTDPYYNPNLDYIRGNFALAFPPRTYSN